MVLRCASLTLLLFILILTSCLEPPRVGEAALPASFGYGRKATPTEIALKDIDVRPDGKGLPPGEGTVSAGKAVYATKCAACHGKTGTEGPFNVLVVDEIKEHSDDKDESVKAIGNYWPYASTLYDYINRAMPFSQPGSLSVNEVYSVTAYLLFANKIIDSSTVMNRKSLPEVIMPALKSFVPDDRRGGPEVK